MMVHFDFIDACCSKSVVAGIDGSNIHWRDNERGRYLCMFHVTLLLEVTMCPCKIAQMTLCSHFSDGLSGVIQLSEKHAM